MYQPKANTTSIYVVSICMYIPSLGYHDKALPTDRMTK